MKGQVPNMGIYAPWWINAMHPQPEKALIKVICWQQNRVNIILLIQDGGAQYITFFSWDHDHNYVEINWKSMQVIFIIFWCTTFGEVLELQLHAMCLG